MLLQTAYLPGHFETVVAILPRWLRSHDVNEVLPQSGLTLLLVSKVDPFISDFLLSKQ